MADATFIKRAQPHTPLMSGSGPERGLGSRWAFAITALILLAVPGWTFIANPDRPAAADDPAYYSWRTEALLSNDPEALLAIDGPLDMYSGGYRVATPVLAGLMRRVADVAPLTPTIVLAVGLRVLVPLLLAGFAYRYRRDPLIWHAVALGSGSLLLTPPFAGYLDNVMTLLFLTAALYFIEPSKSSWRARIAFFALLVISGLLHPTTLAIFCVVLGAMAVARLVLRGFTWRSVVSDDGPMLVTGFLAALAVYAIWKVGVWGEPASLSEAALPPPASAEFFKTRLGGWISAMRPVLNGPLFLIGVIGMVTAGRRAAEDELARVSIVWLAPLAGIFGFLAGIAYPYYRFFNTTLAWVLLVGIGIYFLARFFLGMIRSGGAGLVAVIGIAALLFVIAGNFKSNLELTHWNDVSDAWIKPDERADLDVLRERLPDGPVVFVVDDEAAEAVRIYGFAKRAGNVSRYGVPGESQPETSFFLGSLDDFLAGEPSTRDDYYDELSAASLEDARAVSGDDPTVVVAEVFNRTGSNAGLFGGATEPPEGVLLLADQEVAGTVDGSPAEPSPSSENILMTIFGALLLLLPGVLLVRFLLPGASFGESFGMAFAAGAALLTIVAFVQLALTGSALSDSQAWLTVVISIVISAAGFVLSGFGSSRPGEPDYSTVGS